jgi:LytS/YehU family sensor histidine kinase
MRLMVVLSNRLLKNDPSFQKRVALQLILTLSASLGLVGAAISAYYKWVIGFSIGTTELNIFLAIYAVTCILYNLLFFSNYYLLKENKEKIEHERGMREKIEADFLSFKNEINPDLLYESLENLILTLHHNMDEAEEQIDYLAGIYRYSLVNRQKELVSLEEELVAADHLLRLLNYRYQNNLNLQVALSTAQDIHLIPGSLLITIDTIIRNTLIGARSPLVIRLYLEEEDNYLVLQHSINDRLILHEESLLAFTKLQRSYSFFSEEPFVQVKAGKENYIKFPLVRVAEGQTISAQA